MNRDPIPFIEELGYTPREAAFLYAIGVHSGYFLRRQFNSYIGRVKGAISQHFLNKAERRGHVRAIDCGQNRKVFHLHWKPIYRLLGDEDSQNRRIKGDLHIKSRLMIVDYVLRDTQEHFLESEQAKVEFFTKSCRLSADVLPAGGSKGRHFPDHFPRNGDNWRKTLSRTRASQIRLAGTTYWRPSMNTVRKSLFSLVILAAVLLCAAVPRLKAEDLDRCQRRVAHADHELHEAIARHGRHSRQANHERRELHNARERCWRERHQWWEEHEHRWHKERDWNEHDHD